MRTYLSHRQHAAAAIDEKLMKEFGFKLEQLMELAGLACAKAFCHFRPSVLVLCGPGNNGGDGLVCARHLKTFDYFPTIVYPKHGKNEHMAALVKQCSSFSIPVLDKLPDNLLEYNSVIDAFFGFSFQPPIREPFGDIIKRVNLSGLPVFSIDIPSGWHVEMGPPSDNLNSVFLPAALISLTAPKMCTKFFKGRHYIGGRFVPPDMQKSMLDFVWPQFSGQEQFFLYN